MIDYPRPGRWSDWLLPASYSKPPLGLMPRRINDSRRIREILQAMDRYNSSLLMPIPEEWVEELSDLVWRQREDIAARKKRNENAHAIAAELEGLNA
jgi:hypothetical protein